MRRCLLVVALFPLWETERELFGEIESARVVNKQNDLLIFRPVA